MTKLTVRQAEVLNCIIGYMIEKNRYPTLREIGAKLNFQSVRNVFTQLDSLARKEYIVRFAYRDRGMKVLRDSLGNRIKFVTKVVADE